MGLSNDLRKSRHFPRLRTARQLPRSQNSPGFSTRALGCAVPLSLTAWGQGGSRGQMRLLLCSAHGPRPRGKQEAAVRSWGQSSARCQRDEDPGDVQYVRCDAPVTPMGRDTGNGAVRPPTARAVQPVCRDPPASLKPLHIPRTRMEARFPCPVMERSPGAAQAAFGWAPAPRKVPVGSCGHVGTRAGLPLGGAGCFGCRGFSGPPGHHTLPTERASSCAHLPTRCLVGQLCNRILTEHLTAWRKHPHPPSCASGPPPRAPAPPPLTGPRDQLWNPCHSLQTSENKHTARQPTVTRRRFVTHVPPSRRVCLWDGFSRLHPGQAGPPGAGRLQRCFRRGCRP